MATSYDSPVYEHSEDTENRDTSHPVASYDSTVYEHSEDTENPDTSYPVAISDDQDDIDSGIKSPDSPSHSDASTVEKKGIEGIVADDDDDEHDYTYPDGSGGTFDAPAPTSSLLLRKSEEVMMTEVVMPDNRATSLPNYYKSRPSTKPYKFYGKFHSTFTVFKTIGYILLALVFIATIVVLVLRVSIDHEYFNDEESTTASPKVDKMTSRFATSVSVIGVDGKRIEFTPALEDSESEEYQNIAMAVMSSMDSLYSSGSLKDSYEGSQVSSIREGSVIVDVILTFRSSDVITINEVEDEITKELDRNSNVLSDIEVDPASVQFTDYEGPTHTSARPTVKPTTGTVTPTTTKRSTTVSYTPLTVSTTMKGSTPSDRPPTDTSTTQSITSKMAQSSTDVQPSAIASLEPEDSTTQAGEQGTTTLPQTKPTSTENYSLPPTTLAVSNFTGNCTDDEILCDNSTLCIPIDLICGDDPNCAENKEQLECAIGENSTCAEQRDFLISYCEYFNESCPWIYSCLDDGSWNPVQCSSHDNMCFCVDEHGTYIDGTDTIDSSTPNCTMEAYSPSPAPRRRKKREIFRFEQSCPVFYLQCKNGGCVHITKVGDGIDDCGDNSDEKYNDCGDTPFTCTEDLCVHSDFVCDGVPDCVNGRDEDDTICS